MTDLPIPFSAPMVRALLDGRKTQTRRANHLSRLRKFGKITQFGPSDTDGYDWHFRDSSMRWHDLRHSELMAALPYRLGDRLYVREAWCTDADFNNFRPKELNATAPVRYAADGAVSSTWKNGKLQQDRPGKGRPSMFMPRWASRITLIVTDVRVERLQDISEADAVEEGVEGYGGMDPDCCGYLNYANNSSDGYWLPPVASYASLWDKINGPGAWKANPWIVAYSFRTILQNIDQIERAAA